MHLNNLLFARVLKYRNIKKNFILNMQDVYMKLMHTNIDLSVFGHANVLL